MSITKKDFSVPSSDGRHTLRGYVYVPEGDPAGFFHVVHGMTEHIGRYDRIMSDMCERGYVCMGYDNLGHGRTADDPSELGYVAKRNGWDRLCEDVKLFSDAVRAEYDRTEGQGKPYILMGHSMGSFIVRLASERYVHPDALVIMGTGGKNPAAGAGIAIIKLIKLIRGERHVSRFIDGLAFGSYNKRFQNDPDASPSSWLSTDPETRKKYAADEFCTFKFTASAMEDLMRLLKYSNRRAWFRNVADVPILLVAGEDDPVGNYGKGVTEVCERLRREGRSAECRLYKGARHEILNDFTYESTRDFIIEFCGKIKK